MSKQRQVNLQIKKKNDIDNNISGEGKGKSVERHAAIFYVEVIFEWRHKRNEEARSADISGGKAFEADKIAQGRAMRQECAWHG